jgi:hypothetical protein
MSEFVPKKGETARNKNCAGAGHSFNGRSIGAHGPAWPRYVDVYLGNGAETSRERYDDKRDLDRLGRTAYWQRFEFERLEARSLYVCRFCGRQMGCARCAERPTELICVKCHQWANRFGELEHGKMVVADKVGRIQRAVSELAIDELVADVPPAPGSDFEQEDAEPDFEELLRREEARARLEEQKRRLL